MRSTTNLLFLFLAWAIASCSTETASTLFEERLSETTGIDFENKVVQDGENNVLNYPYYFNGGGVAAGDINRDGLVDLYFTGNMVPNKLYLNKGDLEFEDITENAGVAVVEGWKTGVTMADVNLDGLLDIYVCRSAMSDSTIRKNLLFINNGNLTFSEKADEYRVADNSYSTGAAFFDYDVDGDLDLFVLNHSLPRYAGFNRLLNTLKQQKARKFQSKLYQNQGGHFSDVSENAGIINNVLSFGLGVAISDVTKDGWPDIYVSNDFNEEDYLFINNRDGTFTNKIRSATGHVSLFSMGSDIADINNDALPDIFTLDMLPETNERIKLSSGDDNYDKYRLLISSGFHHQSMRNMLHLNNGDGTFAEIGQLSGISNTDWSWAALFADFDGDGWKDLFVANGYEKDYTNMQFLKYTVDEKIRATQTGVPPSIEEIINNMPAIHVGNFLFKNNGDLTFTKKTSDWGLTRKFKSNGAAYADLDNDGDLDLAINCMNEKAAIYKNNSVEVSRATYLRVDLKESNPQMEVIGSKVTVYSDGKAQYQEFSPSRGFQSCMYGPLSFGLNQKQVDSVRITWPDHKTQVIPTPSVTSVLAPRYADATSKPNGPALAEKIFQPSKLLDWAHMPADTNDFKRQILLPRIFSYSGPRIISGDVNGDTLPDLYACAPQHQPGALFLGQRDGTFKPKAVSAFSSDRESQDEAAALTDVDADGDLDLYVVSGGYAYAENDSRLQDRLYTNDGKGNFSRSLDALPPETLSGSCVALLDLEQDNDIDFFVGTRLVPGSYPSPSVSLFLVNDGHGRFSRGEKYPSDLGMVCDAIPADINNDDQTDLVVAGEWTPLSILINNQGRLSDETAKWISSSTLGWWNCLAVEDMDGDGDPDIVAGNYGLNNQFGVTDVHPATLVHKDFNSDGQVDPFFCYYIEGVSYPYASRDEALGQVATLKPRFPEYTTYANATLEHIFRPEELQGATVLRADILKTVYLENTGTRLEARDLPVQAQFSPVHALAISDVDEDGDKDLVLAGNETYTRVRIGKSDANRGFVLLNDGKGQFTYLDQRRSGLDLTGDIRQLLFVSSGDRVDLIVGENGGPVRSFKLK